MTNKINFRTDKKKFSSFSKYIQYSQVTNCRVSHICLVKGLTY